MKKTISLKLFFTVVWRGICQFFNFIGKLFGYKDKSTYGKVVWRIFAGGGAALMLTIFSAVSKLNGHISKMIRLKILVFILHKNFLSLC